MYCCVRRKNMKGNKKPAKEELVEEKPEVESARRTLDEPKQMNLELAEMP